MQSALTALDAASSRSDQSESVRAVVSTLSAALTTADSGNVATNRKLWDRYADAWGPDVEWVVAMRGQLEEVGPTSERGDGGGESAPSTRCVGDEWSDTQSLAEVMEEFVYPYLNATTKAAEIGSGGGRIAIEVGPRVEHLTCFDISRSMLKRAKALLVARGLESRTRFCLVSDERAYGTFAEAFNFVYCFDVMVHMDLHCIARHMRHIASMLKPSGLAFVSTSNLMAPGGWNRFAKQEEYTVGGFYFTSPDVVRLLVQKAGLEIVKEGTSRASNVYLNRDFLLVLRKNAAHSAAT